MGRLVKGLALSAIASSVVMAGGYKIPEQSINSMALGAAYVAHTMGADTAYYNPANMAFMADKQYAEGAITLAHLPSNSYTLQAPFSGESKEENLLIPTFHYVSNAIGDFRWGISTVVPGGLTKRWETPLQKATAEEFTLKIIEINPSVSYKVSDNFSIGGGLRIIYSEGVVKSSSVDAANMGLASAGIARDMEGDTIEFGYNLALAYKPTNDINIAMTYRSNIDLNEEGHATLKFNGMPMYKGDASVEVPLPAALNLAISKTWNNKFTLEFNYERTFWSEYETLDFEYGGANIGPLTPVFDDPIARNWSDTNTFRLGATIKMDNKFTVMMGFAIDETPVSPQYIGFELPDTDAKIASLGFRYQQTENLSWGAAFLYDSKDPLAIKRGAHHNQSPTNLLNQGGSFGGGGAYLTTVGMAYEF
jgi:long-chain fatty acid transport protein